VDETMTKQAQLNQQSPEWEKHKGKKFSDVVGLLWAFVSADDTSTEAGQLYAANGLNAISYILSEAGVGEATVEQDTISQLAAFASNPVSTRDIREHFKETDGAFDSAVVFLRLHFGIQVA
jgi:hypothetical protein